MRLVGVIKEVPFVFKRNHVRPITQYTRQLNIQANQMRNNQYSFNNFKE